MFLLQKHCYEFNRLSLNISKTNYVIFHPCNKPLKDQITIKINNIALSQKNSLKISWNYNRLHFKLETANKKHFM